MKRETRTMQMKVFRNLSIGGKLTLITMIVSTAALLVASFAFLAKDVMIVRRELLAAVGIHAEMVGNNSTAALRFQDPHDAADVLSALRADANIDAAWIYTPDQRIFASYTRESGLFAAPDLSLLNRTGQEFTSDHVTVCRPVMLEGSRIGTVAVRSNLHALYEHYRDYAFLMLAVLAASSIVALILVARLQRLVTRPIVNLTETAKAVSTDRNYSLRAASLGNEDELGVLLKCFNEMLDEIQRRDEQLQSHRDHLEDEVSARTEELLRVNAELLEAKDRAEAASRAKSAFLANMSHEIRTPMTAIVGFADVMLEPDQTLSDRQDCLQVIRRNGAHLLDLINDILDLSKIEADKMTVERIDVELPQLVAEVVSLMRPRATEKGLRFEVIFSDPTPKVIKTDPLRLRQVLVNLLGNAVKFTASGRIGLTVALAQDSGRVRFGISDSGIGIAPNQVERLFQTFTQADESMTRRFGGTGLGLTISKRLATLLGGDITVQSTVGVGSVFTIEIDPGPLDSIEMLTGVSESLLGSYIHETPVKTTCLHGRILFAEDGPDNQRLISTHLRKAGADVTIANNGKEALAWMVSERFDLVLMDMQMPVLDGYAAASKMRQMGFTLPIVALTAHAMADDRAKCLAAGCSDYLTKPIDKDKLLRALAGHLIGANVEQPQVQPTPAASKATEPEPTRVAETAVVCSEFADDPEMKQLVEEYVGRLPGEVAKLRTMLDAGEIDNLRRVAHQLKGSGGGYGFDQITELASVADQLIKEGAQIGQIRSQIDQLIEYIRKVHGYDATKEADCGAESSDY
jgi:signal transduction histidine kinase/DNA-binding response OmpR family regulator